MAGSVLKVIGFRLAAGVMLAGAACSAQAQQPAPAAFDKAAWLADYAHLKKQMQAQYANLAWFASPQGQIDLPQLDRHTEATLEHAATAAQARAALRAFVDAFHDGHFRITGSAAPTGTPFAEPHEAQIDKMNSVQACASIGAASTGRIPFSLPIESLDKFTLESDGMSQAFRTGLVSAAGGTRIGVVRIPRFRAYEFPALCERAWKTLRAGGALVTARKLKNSLEEAWFPVLADRLKWLKEQGAVALIVDVGGNGGGNDLGDWSTRLFTAKPVRSAPLWMAAGPIADAYFDEQLGGLRKALAAPAEQHASLRPVVQQSLAEFEALKAGLGERACDLSWVWREQRPWVPAGCSRLTRAGFASGARDYLPAAPAADNGFISSAYWAAAADDYRGTWNGPVYVLTDSAVGSAAEAFVAAMRDNGIARIIGTATGGSGCGNMQSIRTIVLPNSHLNIQAPDCVRLRADGSDEVMGIQPDLPLPAIAGESARARTARMLQLIEVDLARKAP